MQAKDKTKDKALKTGGLNQPAHYGFLLLPNFPLVPYSGALESLRMANQFAGKTLYSWETLSVDGQPVTASCGVEIAPGKHRALIDDVAVKTNSASRFTAVFVVSGLKVRDAWSARLEAKLLHLAAEKIPLGALSTGAYLLAKAGLLDGYHASIHWDRLNATREEFPKVLFSDALFEVDRDRYTSSGGTSAIDLMLYLVSCEHGETLAQRVCDQLMLDHLRGQRDRQRIPLLRQFGRSQPRLREAAELMEANLEEPLSPDELAGYVGITRRQLERLFRSHLNCTPMQYYLGVRLDNARRLLLQTDKNIMDISISCGFATAAHFSKCYRDRFGCAPRDDRR